MNSSELIFVVNHYNISDYQNARLEKRKGLTRSELCENTVFLLSVAFFVNFFSSPFNMIAQE